MSIYSENPRIKTQYNILNVFLIFFLTFFTNYKQNLKQKNRKNEKDLMLQIRSIYDFFPKAAGLIAKSCALFSSRGDKRNEPSADFALPVCAH